MNINSKDVRQLQQLDRIITRIGKSEYGATEDYFRREGTAHALPSPSFRFFDSNEEEGDFGLRWYCLRVANEVVVLLNGDRKTAQSPIDCPNCRQHFEFANLIAKQFYEALNVRGEILIEGRDLKFNENFYLKI